MKEHKRVVITGIGMMTPLGLDAGESWNNLIKGKTGVGLIHSFDAASFPSKIGAEIEGFHPSDFLDRKAMRSLNKVGQIGLVAARMALRNGKVNVKEIGSSKVGIYLGVGMVDYEIEELIDAAKDSVSEGNRWNLKRFGEDAYRMVFPLWTVKMLNNIVACQIAIDNHIQGPNAVFSPYAEAGAHAIGEAAKCIQRGDALVMLTGGCSLKINPSSLARFTLMGVLSKNRFSPEKACRPFDLHRGGMVMGEGAGFLVLEELSHALGRGVRIYAELVGYGCASHSNQKVPFSPTPKGISQSINSALKNAGLKTSEIDYINAGAISDVEGDKNEILALKEVFGSRAHDIPVNSNKSMVGCLLAAAEPVDVISSVLSMQSGLIPPTLNYEIPDPECHLKSIDNQAISAPLDIVLSNTYGFNGQCVSLVLKRFQ